MDRRFFIKSLGASSLACSLPISFQLHSATTNFNGKFLIVIQAEGGWDVTSFCDPKTNVSGELEINHWANSAEVESAGNIQYAPFGQNSAFFQKYYDRMMVINGVDAQTNSHTAGVIHNWSGRLSDGFPTLTALYASHNAPNMPIAYVNNGGYDKTGDLIRFTRLEEVSNLTNAIFPNVVNWDESLRYLPADDWALVEAQRNRELTRILQQSQLTPLQRRNMLNYQTALASSESLSGFANALKGLTDIPEDAFTDLAYSSLKKQALLALTAMNSGVCVSADLIMHGFDTHDNHDAAQTWCIEQLTNDIDYLWETAESIGIADRLVVVVGSDFSRTPHYNDQNGKDHWPIGSYLVMEKGAPWANQVFGETDEGHNAYKINPTTLTRDDTNGVILHPKHVMQSLRDYMGVADHAIKSSFGFNNGESFDFFQINS